MFDQIGQNKGSDQLEGKNGKIYCVGDLVFVWGKVPKGEKPKLEAGWTIKKISNEHGVKMVVLTNGREVKTMPVDNFEATQIAGAEEK